MTGIFNTGMFADNVSVSEGMFSPVSPRYKVYTLGDFLSADLGNVYFSSDQAGFNPIRSWTESGTTTSVSLWWLLLSIVSVGTLVIFMQIGRLTDNFLDGSTVGEAPYRSTPYGNYDNGLNMFIQYFNFAGTSVPAGMTSTGSTIINNGVTLPAGSSIGSNATAAIDGSEILDFIGTIAGAQGSPAKYRMAGYSNDITGGIPSSFGGVTCLQSPEYPLTGQISIVTDGSGQSPKLFPTGGYGAYSVRQGPPTVFPNPRFTFFTVDYNRGNIGWGGDAYAVGANQIELLNVSELLQLGPIYVSRTRKTLDITDNTNQTPTVLTKNPNNTYTAPILIDVNVPFSGIYQQHILLDCNTKVVVV